MLLFTRAPAPTGQAQALLCRAECRIGNQPFLPLAAVSLKSVGTVGVNTEAKRPRDRRLVVCRRSGRSDRLLGRCVRILRTALLAWTVPELQHVGAIHPMLAPTSPPPDSALGCLPVVSCDCLAPAVVRRQLPLGRYLSACAARLPASARRWLTRHRLLTSCQQIYARYRHPPAALVPPINV